MFKLLKNLKWIDYLIIVMIGGLVGLQVFLDLRLPDYMTVITQELFGSKDMHIIWVNGGYMLLCAFGSLATAIVVGYFCASLSARFAFNVRAKIYNKIQNFSLDEINKFSTASLITRTTNDVTQIQMVVAMGTQALIKAPILAICAVTKILGKSWQWSSATGVAIGIMFVMILLVVLLALPKFKKIQTLIDNLNRVTRENLTGIRVVRAANAEDFQEAKFEKCNTEITKNSLFANKIMSILGPGMTLLMQGLNLSIYWIGAYIVKDATGFSDMIVFTSYAMQVVGAFMLLVMIFFLMPRAMVSAKRINEVLDTKNEIISGSVTETDADDTSIVFDNVSFKYPTADEYVLKNISFVANRGETIAFIGSTGSGKSTLINLIPRLYDVSEGAILIDGVNVKDYDTKALNKKIGYVPQRSVLFKGSVRSNIDFGDNNANDQTIDEALVTAQAKDFVSKMENGIDSPIAQGGTNVSGGQKQRLSIARAVARKPEIFIFDDSFSALDYKTDRKLRTALKKHTKDSTKFIVAQRIGTIKDADKIIVLEKGNMVGIGTHDELLKTCPVYQEIALSQLSKEGL